MSKKLSTPVSVKTIRGFWQGNPAEAQKVADSAKVSVNSALGVNGNKPRGRLNPAFSAAYIELHPGSTYAEKSAEDKTIQLPVFKTSASGAKLQRPVTVPMSEFRRLSGTSAGRPSTTSKLAAAEAYMKENDLS